MLTHLLQITIQGRHRFPRAEGLVQKKVLRASFRVEVEHELRLHFQREQRHVPVVRIWAFPAHHIASIHIGAFEASACQK